MSSEWPKVKLGDHVDLLSGFPFKSAGFTSATDDVPLVKGENVHQGFIDWVNAKRWPRDKTGHLEKFWLRAGDVILAMDRPWIPAGLKQATVRKHNPPALLVQRVSRLRGTNGLRSDFLGHLIGSSSFTDYIKPIVTGVSVPHISGAQIKGFEFRLPPADQQRRIASILSAYDDLIENNTRRIAILEEMARRIYEEWFVRFRFPGHENVQMVESELGLVPDGWTVEPLGNVCDVTDYVANGSFASLKENVTYCDEKDYAVLVRGTDFNAGWNGKYVYVTEHSYRFLRKSSLKPGDIVVTNVGNVGITFLVPDLAQPMTLGPNSILARPKKGRMYMFLFLRSDEGQHRINGITSGAAQPKFNKTEFRNLRIALPAQEQLDLFEATAGPFYLLAEKLRQSNANLRTTRDLLLPKLISGELDVSGMPEPETAAA